jgi:hypothetical protein
MYSYFSGFRLLAGFFVVTFVAVAVFRFAKRAIDLRVDDEIMCGGKWMKIESIRAYRENWVDDDRYAKGPNDDGYYYYLKGETRTAQQLRDASRG